MAAYITAGAVLIVVLITGTVMFIELLRFHAFAFETNVDALIQESKTLAKRAQAYDSENVLSSLPENPANGFYYRFDMHLDDATIDQPEPNRDSRATAGKNLSTSDFDYVEDGGEPYWVTKGHLDMPRDDLMHMAVTLVAHDAATVEIKWKSQVDLGETPEEEKALADTYGRLRLHLSGDGQSHTYLVKARDILTAPTFRDICQKLFFIPSNPDDVDLLSVRLVTNREYFGDQALGTDAYHKARNERRCGMFARAPVTLTFPLQLPSQETKLAFGVACVTAETELRFTVTSIAQNQRVELWSQPVTDIWQDARVDMSRWASQNIALEFRVNGDAGGVVFLSNPIVYQRPQNRLNIVMVLEDSFRAAHQGCYGYERNTTPVRDELAHKGVIFENAVSQAGQTRQSCPSFMTSLYPTATGVWTFQDRLNAHYTTLAEILRQQGFATYSRTENSNAGFDNGLHQGFSQLREQEPWCHKKLERWLLDHRDRNFFLYLHAMDPHWPYAPPEKHRDWYEKKRGQGNALPHSRKYDPPWDDSPTDAARIARYDGEIRNNDDLIARFIGMLKNAGVYENTLIVFMSDHGEYLGERRLWGHFPQSFYDGVHVPLIFHHPRLIAEPRHLGIPVQNLDIMPTLLEWAGVPTNGLLLQGRSLLPLLHGKPADSWQSRVCVVDEVDGIPVKDLDLTGGSFYFRNFHALHSKHVGTQLPRSILLRRLLLTYPDWQRSWRTQIYNVAENPKERKEEYIALIQPLMKKRLYDKLRALQGSNMRIWQALAGDETQPIVADPAALEQLEDLGYLGG
ncbi:MAG: sulfatase [Candidatus Hydrogenedentota bacterium]